MVKKNRVPWVAVNGPRPIWGRVLDKRPADGATFRAEAGGEGPPPGDAVRLSSRRTLLNQHSSLSRAPAHSRAILGKHEELSAWKAFPEPEPV